MGRPKGSKNKHKAQVDKKANVKKPCTERVKFKAKFKAKWKKKVYPESKYAREERLKQLPQPVTLKIYKLLGFCPKCGLTIGKGDLEKGKKGIIICPACGYRDRATKLSKEPLRKEHPRNKKEFLDDCQDILESMPKITEEAPETPEEIGRVDTEE